VERKHPCLRGGGSCRKGEDCDYVTFPYEACLPYLQGKCPRSPCPDLHMDEAAVLDAKRERFLRRNRRQSFNDESLTLTGDGDGDALTLTGDAPTDSHARPSGAGANKIERSHRHQKDKEGREYRHGDRKEERRHRTRDGSRGREDRGGRDRGREKKRRGDDTKEIILAGPGAS